MHIWKEMFHQARPNVFSRRKAETFSISRIFSLSLRNIFTYDEKNSSWGQQNVGSAWSRALALCVQSALPLEQLLLVNS
jgi:hypothetical protein